ncbi:B- and T-lymphocyte attenuator-like isoform X2 [Alosa sapidissima]|uniref:B- and T-lymphocyte attenuator-like isoform X2 n=1 Tax=Alosa sapidissima TaxID=34773 RepID=UPI001C082581|nr:B- and T-lymphocyte attenuator-like isoform X2 [Alosa sapidissima]
MTLRNVHFFTLSQVILFASLFSTHAQGQNESCPIEVLVKRNSKAEALSSGSLKINCNVTYCDKRPAVGWCKITDSDYCIPVNATDRMEIQWHTEYSQSILSLHFKRIGMNDSGFYRCQYKGASEKSMSHSIHVTVKEKHLDIVQQIVSNENLTANASNYQTTDKSEWFWPALYISSGIALAIIIITVLTCLGLRCRGSQNASTKKADENQYDSVQMSDIGASLPDSSRHAQAKPRPRPHPTPADAQRQGDCVYENGHGRGSRPTSNVSSGDVVAPQRYLTNHVVTQPRMVEEEANPLVYASLNHQVKTRSHTRPIKATEESTEYAAIRIS